MTEHSYLSRPDYIDGHGTAEQRRAFEREMMVLNVHRINETIKRSAPHSRTYHRIRTVIRALVYVVTTIAMLVTFQWLIVLGWAAFGS
jgi:hypothetical protein